jgi:type III pantothenate kinase
MLMLYQTYKIEPEEISKVIIGSVVPQLTKVMSAAIKKIHDIHPVIVDRNTPSGVQAKSKQMGTDIYANLVAAHNMYPAGKKLFWISDALTASCVAKVGKL